MTRPALPLIALTLTLIAGSAQARPPWRLTVDANGASLTDALADSDDAATMLQCTPHDGTVTVYLFIDRKIADHMAGDTWVDRSGAKAPWKTRVKAVSGKVAGDFAASANPSEETGGSEVEAVIPASAPVLAAFAKTGVLRFTAYGEQIKDPPIPAAKAAGLMKACRK